jgi:hypothetical protein
VATARLPDDGIPILTDVVEPGAVLQVAAQARAAAPRSAPQNDPMGKTLPLSVLESGQASGFGSNAGQGYAPSTLSGPPSLSDFPTVPGALSAQSLEDLAARVHGAVLEGLLARIEPMVEARLKETLADLLEQVLADMTAELKVSARNIVRDAVARGVVDEIAALRGRTRPQR